MNEVRPATTRPLPGRVHLPPPPFRWWHQQRQQRHLAAGVELQAAGPASGAGPSGSGEAAAEAEARPAASSRWTVARKASGRLSVVGALCVVSMLLFGGFGRSGGPADEVPPSRHTYREADLSGKVASLSVGRGELAAIRRDKHGTSEGGYRVTASPPPPPPSPPIRPPPPSPPPPPPRGALACEPYSDEARTPGGLCVARYAGGADGAAGGAVPGLRQPRGLLCNAETGGDLLAVDRADGRIWAFRDLDGDGKIAGGEAVVLVQQDGEWMRLAAPCSVAL